MAMDTGLCRGKVPTVSKYRLPINELTTKAAPVTLPITEGPADITLVKPILTRDPITNHLIEQRTLRVPAFTRGVASIVFAYGGSTREVFFAGLLEIVPVANG